MIPLQFLALVARGSCISESNKAEIIQETILGRLPPSRHCRDRLKHTPGLAVKDLKLQLEGQASGLPYLSGYGSALKEHKLGDAIFVLSHSLFTACQYLPERSSYTNLEPQFFPPVVAKGTHPDLV